ncbi:MAG: ATP-binding cassette domain-containing protein [Massilia sp.]
MSLALQRGEVLALLGRNGAGKSTAIAVLLGLRAVDGERTQVAQGQPLRRGAVIGV